MALSGEWEVGLSEITFPRTWYTIDKNGGQFYIDYMDLPEYVGLTSFDKNFVVGETIWHEPRPRVELKVPAGYYETVQDVIKELNKSVTAWCDINNDNKKPDDICLPKFKYSEINKKVHILVQERTIVELSDSLAAILGYDHKENPIRNYERIAKPIKARNVSDVNKGFSSLFVYCDLLECVPLGDTKAPLLRIVDIKGQNGETVHRYYEEPRYVPLQRKNFDSIEIDIRDDLGKNVPFEHGKVIVTVHFRLARNPYFL
jgi:hypothetical protein